MRRGSISAVALCAGLVWANAAVAQPMVDADALWDDGDLRGAREAYRGALDGGGLEPSQTAKAHLRIGIIAAAFGDDQTANAAFRRALAIDPATPAPPDLSPSQRDAFEELRGQAEPIEVSVRETERSAEGVTVAARVAGGEFFQARAVIVRDGSQTEELELTAADFGTQATLPLAAAAIDEKGNVVALHMTSVDAPRALGDGGPEVVEPEEDGSRRGLFIAIGVVAAVVVAGAVALALAFALGDETPQYPEAMIEF